MNKAELINCIRANCHDNKAAASAIDSLVTAIGHALARGEEVSIPGLGKFTAKQRAARTGRNPKTGESILIPASVVPSFKPAKALKDSINN
ncbi:HU family DNA-binding protein [Bowmanella dokdonensis]|uniref:HU family DNA-binding protein n=1 Tax=Bowmanella dokdonensis TaxID=751969 RepID=A0A939DLC3_9ALTE|nr:HU family DNA-binding protein [Bowmanella dokdonensis]MBN7824752.1 HU family DNA-binding protein [Bowmanella dokdonensis]